MKKHRKNEHGAITVFLSLILISVIAFMGMLVDLARIRVAEAQAQRASQMAMDSVMADYSRRLREDYGLFGYAGGDQDSVNDTYDRYYKKNLRPADQEEDGEFLQLMRLITGYEKLRYGDVLNLSVGDAGSASDGSDPLSDPDVLLRQISEFSKFRVPIQLVLSNSLGVLTDMGKAIQQNTNDLEAYDKINEINQPMQEHYESMDAVEKRVKEHGDAADDYNDAVNEWNDLVNGDSDMYITVSLEHEITIPAYEPVYDASNYISYVELVQNADSVNLAPKLSVPAYDASKTVSAFNGLKDKVIDDIAIAITWGIQLAVDNQRKQCNAVLEKMDSEDEAVQEIYDRMKEAEDFLEDCKKEAKDYAEEVYSTVVRDAYLAAFEEQLAAQTSSVMNQWSTSSVVLDSATTAVEKAIKTEKEKRTSADDKVDDITQVIQQRVGDGEVSQDVEGNWVDDKADTDSYLEDSAQKISELEDSVDAFRTELEEKDAHNSELIPADVAKKFVDNAVLPRLNDYTPSWDSAHMNMMEVDFGIGEFKAQDGDREDAYKTAQNNAERERNEAEDQLKKEKKALEEKDKKRYNPEEIPDKYYNAFVTKSSSEDDDTTPKMDKDPRKVKSSEATSSAKKQSGGLRSIADLLGGGLQYIIGVVYGSEYIMRMFGNAAPAQENNEYHADSFEYARVITLRNAVPVGKEEYADFAAQAETSDKFSKARLGYFYNAEVEYILFGARREQTNVTRAQVMLQVILTASNYLQARNNQDLKGIVNAAAAAAAYLGVPPSVTRFVMYMAFAVVESQFDMFYLMHGFKIPAFSSRGDQMFMMNLDANSILKGNGQFMVGYEDYLRLRLMLAMFADYDAVMMRMANLIQLNINYAGDQKIAGSYESDSGFRIDQAYTSFSATSNAKMPYWFMTMAMMEGIRQDSRWYQTQEATLVTSY